jgi:hypothetical protein
MATGDRLGVEELLAGFDEHLRRTRGVPLGRSFSAWRTIERTAFG